MGFFGTTASVIADLNLVAQVILIIFLAFGIYRKKPLRNHGQVMTLSTVFNLATILTVMVPSLILNWETFMLIPTPPGPSIIIVHSIAGTVAIILGLLFSIRFSEATRNSTPLACGKRRLMWATAILWIYSLGGGIAFYLFFYL